jgi:ABC-type nitrate/sulfonate/bicarbonate transport system substrate-binding protein
MIPTFASPQRDGLSRSMVLAGSLVILIAIFTAACSSDPGDAESPELMKISFMAGFRAQANLPFVAAYVGKEKGFFAEEELDVTIRHSSGQDEHLKLLLEDAVQFTTATSAQVLRRRSEEIPVVAVALFGQRGDQGFVTRADSGLQGRCHSGGAARTAQDRRADRG